MGLITTDKVKYGNPHRTNVRTTFYIFIILNVLHYVTPYKVREYWEGVIKNGQSRETGNIDEEKQNKNTTQYVLDTTIRTQTQRT